MDSEAYSLDSLISETFTQEPAHEQMVLRTGDAYNGAALSMTGYVCVLSGKPYTGARHDIGRYALIAVCNEMAASGAEPFAVGIHMLVPYGHPKEQVQQAMQSAQQTAQLLGVDVISAYAEFSAAVRDIIMYCNMNGRCKRGELVSNSGLLPGDRLILTKHAALEGSIIICNDYSTRAYPAIESQGVGVLQAMGDDLIAVDDGMCAARAGASAMSHVSAGGVLAAVYGMGEESGCGIHIEEKHIPLLSETSKLCHALALDPLRLASSGCMLIATRNEEELLKQLKRNNIIANVVGEAVPKEDGMTITGRDGVRRPFTAPRADELSRLQVLV